MAFRLLCALCPMLLTMCSVTGDQNRFDTRITVNVSLTPPVEQFVTRP